MKRVLAALRLGGIALSLAILTLSTACLGATTQARYYAYPAVHDAHGVIAPWYTGLNGQWDLRVRIAAETLKRYPWTDPGEGVVQVPEYVFNGAWAIASDGVITPGSFGDWENGDMGCRAWVVMSALTHYYRYSGDPAALAHITYTAGTLIDHCQTAADHPWPKFLISVPTKGVRYANADPHGMIQLDFVANCGRALISAYQLTGNTRYLETAKHWADVFAQKRNTAPGADPWGRYANPEDVTWNSKVTGGVASYVLLFDDLIRLGYTGTNNSIVQSRDAGMAYIRDKLLPVWTVDDTWGRSYWDWEAFSMNGNVAEAVCWVMMAHKDYFPNWKADVRNILSIYLNRTSVNPASNGDVYSGAWQYPEAHNCCGRSLWYATLEVGATFAQYGVEADSEWGRELARRQEILCMYDIHETGVTEDNIDGGWIVNGGWFKIACPEPLWFVLSAMGWLPDELGANRENHIMRTSGTVTNVVYGSGKITYSTFDAPAKSVDVLRLAFVPTSVTAGGGALGLRSDLNSNGYTMEALSNGDCIVSIRHDGSTNIVVNGEDPQTQLDDSALTCVGTWTTSTSDKDYMGSAQVCSAGGSYATRVFTGNQVRLIGRSDVNGGLADVYIDGVKQLVFIDCYSPIAKYQQVLFYRNGLSEGSHTIRIAIRGEKNPKSSGTNVYIDALQFSAATGQAGYGSGGGPTGAQRWIFGYPKNQEYIDSSGNAWVPATEWTVRLEAWADSVARTWWTQPVTEEITNTSDQELYRYGAHAADFTANFTVRPGTYHARLKFAATRGIDPVLNNVTIYINGQRVVNRMDVAATAGGRNKAVDLSFNNLTPRNGIIDIRFAGSEAFVQAIEVGPGDDPNGPGATPVTVETGANLLVNPGFESGAPSATPGQSGTQFGWSYECGGGYFRPESWLGPIVDGGQRFIHGGLESLATCGDTQPGDVNTKLWQRQPVNPSSWYAASVYVFAREMEAGKGLGSGPNDYAGMRIRELDQNFNLVVDRGVEAIRQVTTGFVQVTKTFKTEANTRYVDFVLDTLVNSIRGYWGCRVIYDDCSLEEALTVTGVSDARALPDGQMIRLAGKTVTAVYSGCFYIEEIDRTSAIRVTSTTPVSAGDVASVIGKLATIDGERVINASSVVTSQG